MPIPASQNPSKLKSICQFACGGFQSDIAYSRDLLGAAKNSHKILVITSTKPKKVSNDFKSKFGCSQVPSNIKLKSYMSNFRSGNLHPDCEDLLRL